MSDALRRMIDAYDLDTRQQVDAVAIYQAVLAARDGVRRRTPTTADLDRACEMVDDWQAHHRKRLAGTYRVVLGLVESAPDVATWVQGELRNLSDRRDYLTAGLAAAATTLHTEETT